MSEDLVEFLRARLDEDEEVAQALGGVRFTAYVEGGGDGWAIESDPGGDPGAIIGDEALARHIAQHDPARVLAEVEAKRRTISFYEDALARPASDQVAFHWSNILQLVLRSMSSPYADHPDYRPEWSPS